MHFDTFLIKKNKSHTFSVRFAFVFPWKHCMKNYEMLSYPQMWVVRKVVSSVHAMKLSYFATFGYPRLMRQHPSSVLFASLWWLSTRVMHCFSSCGEDHRRHCISKVLSCRCMISLLSHFFSLLLSDLTRYLCMLSLLPAKNIKINFEERRKLAEKSLLYCVTQWAWKSSISQAKLDSKSQQ